MSKILAVLFLIAELATAQSTTVSINDSKENQTFGTITNGNVYFHDSNGNTTFGTIRNGNVFLNTSNGEITFGTIKNGNVFLTDQKGVTTGTIRNGNIFLNNSDGSVTTGSYDRSGNVYTSTSGTTSASRSSQDDEWKRQQQENYEASATFGRGLGSAISARVENHRISSFCKADPTATYHDSSGLATPCPNAPLDQWEQTRINEYCADNPGSWTAFGRHRVDCLTPPKSTKPEMGEMGIESLALVCRATLPSFPWMVHAVLRAYFNRGK